MTQQKIKLDSGGFRHLNETSEMLRNESWVKTSQCPQKCFVVIATNCYRFCFIASFKNTFKTSSYSFKICTFEELATRSVMLGVNSQIKCVTIHTCKEYYCGT